MKLYPAEILSPQHPFTKECRDLCLDPRAPAENVCNTALADLSAPQSSYAVLMHDIELALNNPDAHRLPNITERINSVGAAKNRLALQLGMLAATAPLFEYRYRGEFSRQAAVDAYRSIVNLAASMPKTTFRRPNSRGFAAELVAHGILLRSHQLVPFPTSLREEASGTPKLNNDIGVYYPRLGYSQKMPIQVRYSRGSNSSKGYFKEGVLPLFVSEFFEDSVAQLPPSLRQLDATRPLFKLMAEEPERGYHRESRESRVLHYASRSLVKRITDTHDQFQESREAKHVKHIATRMPQDKAPRTKIITGQLSRVVTTTTTEGNTIAFDQIATPEPASICDSGPERMQYALRFLFRGIPFGEILGQTDLKLGMHLPDKESDQQQIGRSLLQALLTSDVSVQWQTQS